MTAILPVRRLALGTMSLTSTATYEQASKVVERFLADGPAILNLADFDYSGRSEEWLGRMLRRPALRTQAFVSIELSGRDMGVPLAPRLDATKVREAVYRALKRLGVHTIDLVNLPRPNFAINPAETLGALSQLADEGSIRQFGTSTFPAWHALEYRLVAEREGLRLPVTELSPYNILDRRIENELLPMALRYELAVLTWAPLAGGVLAGRYPHDRPWPADARATVRGGVYRQRVTHDGQCAADQIHAAAQLLGLSGVQLACRWALSRPGVASAVIGPRDLDQLEHLLAIEHRDEHDQQIETIVDAVNPPGSALADFFNTAPWMKMTVPERSLPPLPATLTGANR